MISILLFYFTGYYYYYWYLAHGLVWTGTRAHSGDRYGSGRLHPRQVLRGSLPLFPQRLDVPTFAARCLHNERDPSSERWNYGRESSYGNFAYMASLFTSLGIFYMPQIYDMGQTALLPLRRKVY